MFAFNLFGKIFQFQAGFFLKAVPGPHTNGAIGFWRKCQDNLTGILAAGKPGHTFCQAVFLDFSQNLLENFIFARTIPFDPLGADAARPGHIGPKGRIHLVHIGIIALNYLEVEHGLAGHSFDFAL